MSAYVESRSPPLASLGHRALRALVHVRLMPDIHERAADMGIALPAGPNRRRRLADIAARRILFVHIPKNGGTSVSKMLYGFEVGHATIRFYRAATPDMAARLPSFAILRDPEERFLSAYRHARAGAAANVGIDPAFRELYRGFRSIDDALDHVEDASSHYAIDHVFRPQSWYITDRSGAVAVDDLIMLDELSTLRHRFPGLVCEIPHLNRSRPLSSTLTDAQSRRIRALYADDLSLVTSVRSRTRRSTSAVPDRRSGTGPLGASLQSV